VTRPRWRQWPRWRDEVSITAALATLACLLALGGWAWRLDRVVYDLGLTLWRRAAPPGIVIIAIDDASVQAIGRWPWRRAVHASLLELLATAKPRAVALDLVLSEADPDPEQDRLLALALQHAAPVVVPVPWRVGSAEPLQATEPTEALRGTVRLGAAEAPVDADGVLRHAFLHAGPPDAPYPHLALALLLAGGETPHPSAQGEHDAKLRSGPVALWPGAGGSAGSAERVAPPSGWQRDGRLLIRYAGPPGTVTQVSYADVLSGAVPASQFSGQYVLVGMTAQGLGDTLATPVNGRHHAMPGVEVLANTLYTLRSGDTIRAASDLQVAVGSVAMLALLVASFGAFGPRRALPTALAAVPVALAVSLLALRSGWWFNPVPAVCRHCWPTRCGAGAGLNARWPGWTGKSPAWMWSPWPPARCPCCRPRTKVTRLPRACARSSMPARCCVKRGASWPTPWLPCPRPCWWPTKRAAWCWPTHAPPGSLTSSPPPNCRAWTCCACWVNLPPKCPLTGLPPWPPPPHPARMLKAWQWKPAWPVKATLWSTWPACRCRACGAWW
jgi:CHASE2 domain-containing sensor protein